MFMKATYKPPSKKLNTDTYASNSSNTDPTVTSNNNQNIDTENERSDIEINKMKTELLELREKLRITTNELNEITNKESAEKRESKRNELLFKLRNVSKAYQKLKENIMNLKGSYDTRNVNKRLKIRESKIETLSENVKELQNDKAQLAEKLTVSEKIKRNAQKLASYYKLKFNNEIDKDAHLSDLSLKEEIQQLECEIEELKTQIEEILNEKNYIETFTSNKYKDSVRQCYIDLMAAGVAVGKCGGVVKSVITNLTNLKIDRLPGKTQASMLQVEAQLLSEQQAVHTMLESDNNTLHTDNTKKKSREYCGFQLSTEKGGPLFLNILEMASGNTASVEEALQTTMESLADNVCTSESEKRSLVARLNFSIKNLMTDRHIVNKCFVSSLEEWRKELLPEMENLKENPDACIKINFLFCGLHVLANMATYAKKCIENI